MTSKHPQCLAIEADLVATAAGEAAGEAAERVRAHVDTCRPCAEDLRRYRAIEDVVGRIRTVRRAEDDERRARDRLAARLADLRRRLMSYGVFPSPLGHILLARTEDGVSLVQYLGPSRDPRDSRLGRAMGPDAVEDGAALEAFYHELLDYLEGRRTRLEWPLDLRLARSDFHRDVLRVTAGIPYGAVRSYAGIACDIGKPTAARAVAQALRWNPLPIVVPCHRVVGSSGALVGYAGDKVGLKERLLDVEGVPTAPGLGVPRGAMYVTLPGEASYCLPTCGWVAAAERPHRFVFFGSRARAEAAGLVPCGECRPDLHPLAS
jgi:methylated-DNA-[protein]-cysteine S-methyltransferase